MAEHVWRSRVPIGFLLVAASSGCSDASVVRPPRDLATDPVDLSSPWEVSSAEAEGFDSRRLDAAFAEAALLENIRALLVVRNGRIVREAYFNGTTADTVLDVRSVTKTATALLVGIAADDGLLDVEDELAAWFPPDSLAPEHDGIRVRHLLTMTSGIEWTDEGDFVPWIRSGRPIGYVLDLPVVAAPDAVFIYNTGGSHLLAEVVAGATGGDALAFAEERLFEPLGVTGERWLTIGGQPSGGAGLALRARDLARLGQLVLQRGNAGGRRVVSEAWIDEAFARRVALGSVAEVLGSGGYGYQVWTESAELEAFVMWGFGGQFVWVVPEESMVVVGASHWSGIGYPRARDQADAPVRG